MIISNHIRWKALAETFWIIYLNVDVSWKEHTKFKSVSISEIQWKFTESNSMYSTTEKNSVVL